MAAGLWGYFTEDRSNQNLVFAVAYFWMPLAALICVFVSRGRYPRAILGAVGILDIEAALLGFGPLIALPFAVAVPLIGVAVAARLISGKGQVVAYLAAWAASSIAVASAVLIIIDDLRLSAVVVVPAFMFVDALALWMLWRLDAGRLNALRMAAAAESAVRDLLDGVNLIGVHVNADSRIDYINDFGLQTTGWKREEVLGADWWETFAPPDRREEARARWARTVAGADGDERKHDREGTILTRAGDLRLVRWSQVTRHDKDGRVTGLASLGQDITEIRAAEDAAKRGAEMLATLVVSSPLPTIVLSLERMVQLWNPAAVELLGWTEEEVLGRPMPPVFLGRDQWAIARRFVAATKGRALDHEALELHRRDGQVIFVRLYGGVLLDRDGKPMSVGLQAIDATQTLAVEEQLREAQKMEAVGRLAGGVAHDFNNSLTAIGGFAALIASGTKEADTREAAETIVGASKRAADLTRELLAYSRRSLLQPQVIEVNELIGVIRPMLLRLVGRDVSVVLESLVPVAAVRIDPGGLERAILNLGANARDAMLGGGLLTVSIDRKETVSASGGEQVAWISISVSDTGAGIPARLHSQVFDPFFTTKPVGSGTGLGLAMVKGFVVQSGGEVSLRSEPGRGTTIEILLPEVADTRRPVAAVVAVASLAHEGETVLVVEDEPAVAAVSLQVLSRAGYRVLLADSGESAIGVLRGHSGAIDLFFVDVILPGMRGPQLVEIGRVAHPESAVLFASGYSEDSIGRHGELHEGVDFIAKPYAPEDLLRRVRESIDRPAVARG
ncbi:MAG TPA: PAS domain S-box protein [Candidatus Limnocylindrales bacterium]